MKDNVVDLPLARWAAGIHERRILPVDSCGLAVRVGLAVIRIKHLHLVEAHQEHAAISAILVFTARGIGRSPFEMQLAVPERVASVHVSGAGDDFEIPVSHSPLGRSTIGRAPFREVLAIKQDRGIRRRFANVILRAALTWCHHRCHRAVPVVNVPLLLASLNGGHENSYEQ